MLASHPDFEPLALADLGLKPGETRAGVVVALRRGAIVTGIVTAGGEPLAGAQASVAPGRSSYGTPPRSLSGPQWSWPRATTGADGRFRLSGLSPGEYVLTVYRTGWATETRDATIVEGKGPDPFTIALAPEAVVSGRVVGKKGGGVAAQNVYAQAVETRDRSSGYDRTAPDGSFRFEGLKAGVAYNLYLYGTGSNTPKAVVTPPAERVEVVVNGTGRLAGRVVDPDGRPVTAYQVTAQADRSSGGSGWFDSARQDVASEAGEFAFDNAPAGALEVRVVAKGYQAARVGGVVVEEGEAKEGVEVRLSRGASLKGRVVEARGGTPVAGAEVSAESAPARVVAGADGAFEFEALAPGKVRVTATSPDFVSASENVEVGESGASVELKMSAGASVSATVVTPGGEPVPGAEVAIAPGGTVVEQHAERERSRRARPLRAPRPGPLLAHGGERGAPVEARRRDAGGRPGSRRPARRDGRRRDGRHHGDGRLARGEAAADRRGGREGLRRRAGAAGRPLRGARRPARGARRSTRGPGTSTLRRRGAWPGRSMCPRRGPSTSRCRSRPGSRSPCAS